MFNWKLRVVAEDKVAVALHDEGSATVRELADRVEDVAGQEDVALVTVEMIAREHNGRHAFRMIEGRLCIFANR